MKRKFENKKVLIILILVLGALCYVFNMASSNMDNKSEQLEKKVKELKVNRKDSMYILKSDAIKNNIPYIKGSETTINGKKYCKYSNSYELYAKALFAFYLFFTIGSVLCVAKLATILGQEIGKKTIDIEKNKEI